MGFPADHFVFTMFPLVVSFVDDSVWAVEGGCELVLVQQRNVGLWTRTFIILVVNEFDSLELGCHAVGNVKFVSGETDFE